MEFAEDRIELMRQPRHVPRIPAPGLFALFAGEHLQQSGRPRSTVHFEKPAVLRGNLEGLRAGTVVAIGISHNKPHL